MHSELPNRWEITKRNIRTKRFLGLSWQITYMQTATLSHSASQFYLVIFLVQPLLKTNTNQFYFSLKTSGPLKTMAPNHATRGNRTAFSRECLLIYIVTKQLAELALKPCFPLPPLATRITHSTFWGSDNMAFCISMWKVQGTPICKH